MSSRIDHRMRAALSLTGALAGAMAWPSPRATAAFVEYKQNQAGWESAVGSNFTTLDFNFGQQLIVTDQYLAQGAIFTDGSDITEPNAGAFPNDGWGLAGSSGFASGPIVVEFTQPMNWIAVEHPGNLRYEVFSGGQLLYVSSNSGFPPADTYFFGLVSDTSFDKVVIRDPLDNFVFIDDLYFGAPVPAPGGVAVLLAGLLMPARRRRS